MKRIYLILGAVAVALVVTAAATPMALPKLTGTVGPGFTISLKRGLAPVKLVKAGKYTVVVSDKSSIHSFHLTGPGVNKVISAVGFVGSKTVVVTLKKGTYSFFCDVHPSMHGSFKVA